MKVSKSKTVGLLFPCAFEPSVMMDIYVCQQPPCTDNRLDEQGFMPPGWGSYDVDLETSCRLTSAVELQITDCVTKTKHTPGNCTKRCQIIKSGTGPHLSVTVQYILRETELESTATSGFAFLQNHIGINSNRLFQHCHRGGGSERVKDICFMPQGPAVVINFLVP